MYLRPLTSSWYQSMLFPVSSHRTPCRRRDPRRRRLHKQYLPPSPCSLHCRCRYKPKPYDLEIDAAMTKSLHYKICFVVVFLYTVTAAATTKPYDPKPQPILLSLAAATVTALSSSTTSLTATLGNPPSQKLTLDNFLFWKALVLPPCEVRWH
jgi:hypothetical protein